MEYVQKRHKKKKNRTSDFEKKDKKRWLIYFKGGDSPVLKVVNVYVFPGEVLGLSLRGGSDHGLGLYVSRVERQSAAGKYKDLKVTICCI